MVDIMLVGESYSSDDEDTGRPFSGTSGWMLDQLLAPAGISRRECYVTNVFNLRAKSGDVKNLCGPKATAIKELPALAKGLYIRAEYANQINRLYEEVKRERPNVVVAMGATAAWAFMHTTGIKPHRGAVAQSCAVVTERLGFPQKILPTYHPSMVQRDYSASPVVMADLDKAKRESKFPEVRRPVRNLWLYPTLADLQCYEDEYIAPASLLSIDIETKGDQITCIGFSPSADSAIVIPLFQGENKNYWATPSDELVALNYVRRWCAMRPSVFQNGMYDIKFLWQKYGIPMPLAAEDTMLLHHAWQPEMEKGLGFLATLYTDSPSWKHMRSGKKHD